jgi:DNA repair exonuclease SbcCD ATPase subunit
VQRELASFEQDYRKLSSQLLIVEAKAIQTANRRASVPFNPDQFLADKAMENELLKYYGVKSGDLCELFKAKKADLEQREVKTRKELNNLSMSLKMLERGDSGGANSRALNRHFVRIKANINDVKASFVEFHDDTLRQLKEARNVSVEAVRERVEEAMRKRELECREVEEFEGQIRKIQERREQTRAARATVEVENLFVQPDFSQEDETIQKVRKSAHEYEEKLKELDNFPLFKLLENRLSGLQQRIDHLNEKVIWVQGMKSARLVGNWEVLVRAFLQYERTKLALEERMTELQRELRAQGPLPSAGKTENEIEQEIKRLKDEIKALRDAQTHEELEHVDKVKEIEQECTQLQNILQDLE